MISMERMNLVQRKKKKDFKIRENLVIEFERLAPSGKQTTIIENLIAGWIAEQRREVTKSQIRKAYERRARR